MVKKADPCYNLKKCSQLTIFGRQNLQRVSNVLMCNFKFLTEQVPSLD